MLFLGSFFSKTVQHIGLTLAPHSAALKGCPLVLDEIHKAGGELDAPLQSVLDDQAICKLNLDNGETVTPTEGYRVIATMNGSPDQLAEAVLRSVRHCSAMRHTTRRNPSAAFSGKRGFHHE